MLCCTGVSNEVFRQRYFYCARFSLLFFSNTFILFFLSLDKHNEVLDHTLFPSFIEAQIEFMAVDLFCYIYNIKVISNWLGQVNAHEKLMKWKHKGKNIQSPV